MYFISKPQALAKSKLRQVTVCLNLEPNHFNISI